MNLQEIKKDIRFITSTSDTDFSDDDLVRSINRRYDEFVTFIWQNQGHWKFGDSSYSTLDKAATSLTDNQQDYVIPTDAREIHRVEIKHSNGKYYKLRNVYEDDVEQSLDEYYGKPGAPLGFAFRGRSLILYPAPSKSSVTLAGGLVLYVSRSVSPLEDDEDEPAIDREFHRVLTLGAASDWCMINESIRKKREIDAEIERIKEKARWFYGNRNQSAKARLRPKRENYA